MNGQGSDRHQERTAHMDLHQLVLQGRALHDRAVFEALASLFHKIRRFLAVAPLADDGKYAGSEEVSLR